MRITSDAGVNALLDELLSRMRETIGATLAGLYLYGSLVGGDFDRHISDIDLLAVTASDINDTEFRVLHSMHTAFTHEHPAWEDRLDIVYVSAAALRAFGTKASAIAVISPGEPFHIKEAEPGWLMNWYLVREQGRSLFGPPPSTFIRPIITDEFVETVREHARSWSRWIDGARTRRAQAYAVLTMCRALYAHKHGAQVSKDRAAAWAAQELPQWSSLIHEAVRWRREWRDGDVDHAATLPETRRFVQAVIRRIAAG